MSIETTNTQIVVEQNGSISVITAGIQGPAGAGIPSGSDGQIQYNDDGMFGAFTLSGAATVNPSTGVMTLASAIDAAKLADGSVSNTEFQYLNGVTNAIQTQLDGKAASSHSHAAADITSGAFADARIAESNITQHEAALSLTASQVSDFDTEVANNSAVAANTAKVTNATHTGDVTGATVLTIANSAVTNAKVATGIDAAKLADGSVSNTEFQYINSLTSNAQTQLNAKAPQNSGYGFSALASATTLTAGAFTKIAFSIEDFDPAGEYDATTNYRYTPQKAGKYYVSGMVQANLVNSGKIIFTAIFKNGSRIKQVGDVLGSTFKSAECTALVDMNGTTDYVEMYIYHSDSVDGALDTPAYSSHFSAFLTGV